MWVSNVCLSGSRSIHKKFAWFLHAKFHVCRGRWAMHEGMQFDPIQRQGHKPFRVGIPSISKCYLLRHLQWELATDHSFLNYGTVSKFVGAGFLILVLVFVSHDFEVGRNVSCEESTVSLCTGLIYYCLVVAEKNISRCVALLDEPTLSEYWREWTSIVMVWVYRAVLMYTQNTLRASFSTTN